MTGVYGKIITVIIGVMLIVSLFSCGKAQTENSSEKTRESAAGEQTNETAATDDHIETRTGTENDHMEKTLHLRINDTEVFVEWENNETVRALIDAVTSNEITIRMSMYGGFEQVGPLGQSLPRNDVQTTTSAGDIMLYSGDQIVIFYGANSWAYTRLGRIADLSAADMEKLLGGENVTLTISYE